ncbi:MAG TPA: DUF1571 domain-containing protein [Polyangia bacterium]
MRSVHTLVPALLLAFGIATPAQAEAPSPGQVLAARALTLSESERARSLAALSAAERAEFFRALGSREIVALGRQTLGNLGVYQARVTREERVRGRLHGPDVVEVTVRESPRAVLLDFVAGTHKGRRALYNAELRAREMLARESGVLGLFSMWLALESSLVHRDTNHNITDVGFGAMMDVMQADLDKAAAAGGFQRSDEGFDARGLFCMLFTAPAGAKGLYAARLRYCVDGKLGLPMKIEVFDEQGRREYVEYHNLQVRLSVREDFFTPAAAGL